MIVGRGVLIPADDAAAVATALVRAMRYDGLYPPRMLRLRDELSAVAAEASVGVRSLDGVDVAWLSPVEMAQRLRCSPRTVRRRAAAGTLVARKERGTWRVAQPLEAP